MNCWLNREFYQRIFFFLSLVSDITDDILPPKSVCLRLPNGMLEHGARKPTTDSPRGTFLVPVGSILRTLPILPNEDDPSPGVTLPQFGPRAVRSLPKLLICGLSTQKWSPELISAADTKPDVAK